MADSFISEYFYQSTASSSTNPEFVEIALAPGTDPSTIVVSFYDTDGNLETGVTAQNAVAGEVTLSSLVGVPDPDNPGWTIYTIESSATDGRLLNGGDGNNTVEANYITLTDTSTVPNTVLDGYGIGSNDTEMLSGGAADGSTVSSGGTHSGNTSVKYDYLGNRTDGTVEGGPHTDNDAIVPCFVTGAMLLTNTGERRVEDLSVGDLLKTADGRLEQIRWIGSKRLTSRQLLKNTNLRPIRIAAGALGQNLPQVDLTVSPQHRMVVRSKISERMFGPVDVLVAAKHLLDLPGVDVVTDYVSLTYYHIMFDEHEVIFANGALTESLLAGPQAMRGMSQAQREEITFLFPEIIGSDVQDLPQHVIPVPKKQKELIARHTKNQKSVLS